jgi:hypothetical protein
MQEKVCNIHFSFVCLSTLSASSSPPARLAAANAGRTFHRSLGSFILFCLCAEGRKIGRRESQTAENRTCCWMARVASWSISIFPFISSAISCPKDDSQLRGINARKNSADLETPIFVMSVAHILRFRNKMMLAKGRIRELFSSSGGKTIFDDRGKRIVTINPRNPYVLRPAAANS